MRAEQSTVPDPLRPTLNEAVDIIRHGGVVAMPTETVYGLAADARNKAAVARVFALKQRPLDHPLIVHLASAEEMDTWAASVPPVAKRLAATAWPGPLTLVLRARDDVPRQVTGGQDTVALRVPDHPLALALIRGSGGALVAPSANRFGQLSPTCAEHVLQGFGETPPPVLDGGPCRVGIESSVVLVDDAGWQVLRPGHWTEAALEHIARTAPLVTERELPRTPGQLASHYAPHTPLILLPDRAAVLATATSKDGLLLFGSPAPTTTAASSVVLANTPELAAQQLYAALHHLDAMGRQRILAEQPPAGSEWAAIRDRLQRAQMLG